MPEVIPLLQVHPERRGGPGERPQFDRILSRHSALPVDQLVQAHKRPAEPFGSFGLRDRRVVGLQEFLEQDLSRMDRFCGLHRECSQAAAIADT